MGAKLNFKGGLVKNPAYSSLYLKFQDSKKSFACDIKSTDGWRLKGYWPDCYEKIAEGELTSW